MSKNLLTKFRKFWRTLSPLEQRRLWSIMTALRGEDKNYGSSVKKVTTARIRGLLLGKKLSVIADSLGAIIAPNPSEDLKDGIISEFHKISSGHFTCHIRAAINALKPYVPKKKFSDLLRFL